MFGLPTEVLTLLGGSCAGFIFKMMAQNAADRAAQFEMMLKTIKASDDSSDAAIKRVPNDKAGSWIRRTIVLAVLFGVILGPFLLALLDKPVIVEITHPVKQWLFGLFSTGGTPKFYQLQSYLLIPEVRQSLMAIIGFYFGQGCIQKR